MITGQHPRIRRFARCMFATTETVAVKSRLRNKDISKTLVMG